MRWAKAMDRLIMVAAVTLAAMSCQGQVEPFTDFTQLVILPERATLLPGSDTVFAAVLFTITDSTVVSAQWSATGGATIGTNGRYTAGQVTGEYLVVATVGNATDTASVQVSSSPIERMQVQPDSAIVTAGGSFTFQAVGVDADSQAFPISAAWSASAGAINGLTGEWTAPTTLGRYEIYATNGLFSDTAIGLVDSIAAPPPPPQGTDEPSVRSSDSLVYKEDYERFGSTADLKAAFADRETNGTINLDNVVAFEGQKSFRIDWPFNGCLGAGDADVLIERGVRDPGGAIARDWYVSYYSRFVVGYLYTWAAGCPRGNASKEMIFFRNGANTGGRITWVVEITRSCPDIYGDLLGERWNFDIDQEPGAANPGQCGGRKSTYRQHLAFPIKAPATLGDGAWHRVTIRIKKESQIDAGDGVIQVWIDGVLIMNYNGEDPDDPAFQKVYTRTMAFGQPIQYQTVINGGAPRLQSRWYDDLKVWFRP